MEYRNYYVETKWRIPVSIQNEYKLKNCKILQRKLTKLAPSNIKSDFWFSGIITKSCYTCDNHSVNVKHTVFQSILISVIIKEFNLNKHGSWNYKQWFLFLTSWFPTLFNDVLFYTAPTVAPIKPGIYSVLKHCPDTVHCMTTCKNGYTLDGESTGCPRCSCNQGMIYTVFRVPTLHMHHEINIHVVTVWNTVLNLLIVYLDKEWLKGNLRNIE